MIALDRKVSVGQWIHVDLTWDDRSGAYRAFVDGREVKARPGWYDRKKKSWLPDPRAVANRRRRATGQTPLYPSRPSRIKLI